MLTGIRVTILGGDARQLEVIRALCLEDASVALVGYDEGTVREQGAVQQEMTDELLSRTDALVLPAVMGSEAGEIQSRFSSRPIRLTASRLALLPEHASAYTGYAKPGFVTMCAQENVNLIQLFERDDVAIYNSIPTAEGALKMAIEHTDFTLHGSRCLVLGMGRTGITMARTLQGVGADVRIGVRREEHFARGAEMGMRPFHTDQLAEVAEQADLLFNTVPSTIVTAEVIKRFPPHTVIIDLASSPGGTDFRFAEKRGIKAMLAPGLPGIVAPKTAGRIMARTLIQLLHEKFDHRRDSHGLEK